MAYKRLDPSLRFSDVVPIWEQAVRDKGGVIDTDDDNATIALVYRLNQYRKIIRELSDKGWTDYDRYVVRRGHLCVHIEPRMNIDLMSRMRRLDGSPITPREIKPSDLDHVAGRLIDDDDEPFDPSTLSPADRKLYEESLQKAPSPNATRLKP